MVRVPITTTIDLDLRNLLQEREICIADLLEDAAKEILQRVSVKQFRELQEKLFKVNKTLQILLTFVEEKGLGDEWRKKNVLA